MVLEVPDLGVGLNKSRLGGTAHSEAAGSEMVDLEVVGLGLGLGALDLGRADSEAAGLVDLGGASVVADLGLVDLGRADSEAAGLVDLGGASVVADLGLVDLEEIGLGLGLGLGAADLEVACLESAACDTTRIVLFDVVRGNVWKSTMLSSETAANKFEMIVLMLQV
jgi:hypothetical protein